MSSDAMVIEGRAVPRGRFPHFRRAGDFILAGAATAAEALAPGDHVTLEAQELGRVEFQMTAEGSAE
ncbi:hypothetical protein [Niveispirillum cyanobacteriorum]|uniref:hypothetical protein n=1 Tax=Niveispirillum cyanobacteriorum TaxID=1612173 RepID=UPI0018F81301|nr:hypothetical protein [Niveispirillum cyanobacteriorum]